ncbi:MAG: ATP-binding protein [Candidatus Omnitrophota bacterium]|jgi:PAS domain S-box-containing protein
MMNARAGKKLTIFTVLCAGVFISLALFYFSYRSADARIKGLFNDAAAYRFKFIEDMVQNNVSVLQSFGDLYAASDSIETDEFGTFAEGIFARNTNVFEFRWVARVRDDERDAFELATAKAIGLADFHIKELGKNGNVIAAGRREEYYPVCYIAAADRCKGDKNLIYGIDAASFPERRYAMSRACDTASPTAANEIKIIGESFAGTASRVYLPIYRNGVKHDTLEERRKNLIGFAVSLWRIDEIGPYLDMALSGISPIGVDMSAYADTPQGPKFLYFRPSRMRKNPNDPSIEKDLFKRKGAIIWTRPLMVADTKLLVVASPAPEFLEKNKIILAWVILLTGLILTLMLAGYLRSILRRSQVVEALVKLRTEELVQTKERYESLVNNLNTGIYRSTPGPEGRFLEANPTVVKMFNAPSREEFLKVGVSRIYFNPSRRKEFSDNLLTHGVIRNEVSQYKTFDGRIFWGSVTAVAKKDEDGNTYFDGIIEDVTEKKEAEAQIAKIANQQQEINKLQQTLLAPAPLDSKAGAITDGIVRIFDVDFCRIWLIRPGDLCDKGCVHAGVKDGPHVCRFRDKCLHLVSSSGRYAGINGSHQRVPFDCYKIGRIASGKEHRFLTNDVINDPKVHDHEWARKLGLVSFAGYKLRIPDGKVFGVLALFAKHKITPGEDALLDGLGSAAAFVIQQVAAEESLARANKEWADTFDAISDIVFILNKDSNITKVNKVFLGTFKLKESDVIGKKCYEVVHKKQAPWINCPHQKTIADGKPHTEQVDDPALGLPLLVSTSPIFDEKGQFIGTVHIAKDISNIRKTEAELRKAKEDLEIEARVLAKANDGISKLNKDLASANEQLKKLDQLKTDFVSNVSHELRTPLSIVKEGVSLILDKIPGDVNEKQEHILSTAKNNIDRLTRIIDDLLDMSKIESGKVVLNKTKFNINDLAAKITDSFITKANSKGLKINVTIPDKEIFIHADADRINEVFINLINNAIKFTEKGSIDISIKDNADFVLCSVADTGMGISKENLPKIFNKFQQFSRAAGPGEKGTGLGLSIVKGIIDLHKGDIRIDSELGKGSVFTFTLPKSA